MQVEMKKKDRKKERVIKRDRQKERVRKRDKEKGIE